MFKTPCEPMPTPVTGFRAAQLLLLMRQHIAMCLIHTRKKQQTVAPRGASDPRFILVQEMSIRVMQGTMYASGEGQGWYGAVARIEALLLSRHSAFPGFGAAIRIKYRPFRVVGRNECHLLRPDIRL